MTVRQRLTDTWNEADIRTEECEFPIKLMFTSGKGKETAQSTVRARLKWTGREEEIRRAGLPSKPPRENVSARFCGHANFS